MNISAFSLLVLCAVGACTAQATANMNGNYPLSNTPHSDVLKFPKSYNEYGRDVHSFDLYSPVISQLYSQVFWKGLDPIELPPQIVAQYKGKGMAVVGYEMDQVRRVKDSQGNLQDISIPFNVVYNHHYETTMIGSHAKFTKIHFTGPHDPRLIALRKSRMGGHGMPSQTEHWMVEDLNKTPSGLHSQQAFGGTNGGEARLSFHGYAPSFAQVIESPTQFQFTPMQIDTWNRDKMNVTGPTTFVPGPVPRTSLAPTEGPDAIYSGLLECPMTTRLTTNIHTTYVTRNGRGTSCNTPILTMQECASAASKIAGNGTRLVMVLDTGSAHPFGCTMTSSPFDASLAHVYFHAVNNSISACGQGTTDIRGTTQSLVNVSVYVSLANNIVQITLAGPADVWFGVGFNASAMKDQPWAVIVEGGLSGNITERRLQDQNPGEQLPPTITVVSVSISGNTKQVVLTRPLDNGYFSFDNTMMELPFINALGSQPTLSYHRVHTPSSLTLLPVQDSPNDAVAGICICEGVSPPFGQGQGTFTYTANSSQPSDSGSGTVSFNNVCPPEPRSDLLSMMNPTCDARTYVGGQIACHHMWSLLDADQEIPWADQPIEYHLKFRFWVQPYNATYHQQVFGSTWGIASPVEYDVPQCAEGIKGCSKNPSDGSWEHTIMGTYAASTPGKLVAAHFHCHAPSCKAFAMYRCDMSKVDVCNSTTGELLCMERPIFGGTGMVPNKKFDEPGFILQPPCLWGDSQYGLEPPPDVDPTRYMLHSVKTNNATFGHHGDMAWQQMYLIP